jgi:NADH-quinone oxidoreductase subunit K
MTNSIDPGQLMLILSAILFSLGLVGVCIRRNPLIMFMCIELMLNAANLAFAAFSRYSTLGLSNADPTQTYSNAPTTLGGAADGTIFIFLVMTIAAAEAVVGLAIIIAIFRSRSNVDADDLAALKG